MRSKATFSFISSPLSILRERQFEIKEKNEKRKVKRTKKGTAIFFRKLPFLFGAPGGTRTPDPLLRRQLLYPPELQTHYLLKSEKTLEKLKSLFVLERVMGIEPTQPAWKAGILAIELHPRF